MVDQGSEFYNSQFKRFLKDNSTEMYSTYSKRKSVIAERFIKPLKNTIFKNMTAASKNFDFDVLDDLVEKYNNTVHRSIGLNAVDAKCNS